VAYRRFSPLGKGSFNARFWDPDTELPCQHPPWAEANGRKRKHG